MKKEIKKVEKKMPSKKEGKFTKGYQSSKSKKRVGF